MLCEIRLCPRSFGLFFRIPMYVHLEQGVLLDFHIIGIFYVLRQNDTFA
jgi:hypothetical protein